MRPLAIELAFDSPSDRRLGMVWARLSALYARPVEAELGIRPHVTLALFRQAEPKDLQGVAKAAAATLVPFRLSLSTADTFPGDEGVVFLRPEASAELAHAHAMVSELLVRDRDLVDEYYRPDVWRPHCTMAINVPQERIGAVLSACREAGVLGDVHAARLQLVRYSPLKELWSADLGGARR